MAGLKKPKPVPKVMPLRKALGRPQALIDLEAKLKKRRDEVKMGKKKTSKPAK